MIMYKCEWIKIKNWIKTNLMQKTA